MNIKKIVGLVVSLALMIPVCNAIDSSILEERAISVGAEESTEDAEQTYTAVTEFEFTYDMENSTATLTKFVGSSTEVRIPPVVNGYTVTTIGASAFYDNHNITSVTMPNTVTTIGKSAFGGCSYLTSVNIPNSVTTIGNYAFFSCGSLTSITIPGSVTTIGEYALGCYQSGSSYYKYSNFILYYTSKDNEETIFNYGNS